MIYGFVYVLSNYAMPGIYKVGMTNRPPRERVDELSKATSVPLPFELVLYAQVRDAGAVERDLHQELDMYRLNSSREFFQCSIEEIKTAIQQAEEVLDICYVTYSWLAHNEECDRREKFQIDHFLQQSHDVLEWPIRRGFE